MHVKIVTEILFGSAPLANYKTSVLEQMTDQLTKRQRPRLDMYTRDKQDSIDMEWVRVPHLGECWSVRHHWKIRM